MRRVSLRRILTCGLMIVMLAALTACPAAPARIGHMVPESTLSSSCSADSPLCNAIAISKVGGGEKTNPLLVSKVGDKELHETLRLSLERFGFLSTSDVAAAFRLEVFLVVLKQPPGGYTTIVTSVMRYKLTRNSDDQVVYDDIVTASYTVTVDDVFYGVHRLKVANEGSIRTNIAVFLQHLHSLNISESPIK